MVPNWESDLVLVLDLSQPTMRENALSATVSGFQLLLQRLIEDLVPVWFPSSFHERRGPCCLAFSSTC